jgi:hypothetical protein
MHYTGMPLTTWLVVTLLLVALLALESQHTVAASDVAAAAADHDDFLVGTDDVIGVDTLDTDAFRERRARRKKHGKMPPPVHLSHDDEEVLGDDSDAAGENDFGSLAASSVGTYSFTPGASDPTAEKPKQQQQPHEEAKPKRNGESRKEQYERKQREYQGGGGDQQAPKAPPSGPATAAFTKAEPKAAAKVAEKAAHAHAEMKHYHDWLNTNVEDRRIEALKATVDDDALAELQLDALARLPLPAIAGHELTHIRTAIDRVKRQSKKLQKEAAKALKAIGDADAAKLLNATRKHGKPSDLERAVQQLKEIDAIFHPNVRDALEAHHALHRALAASAMASSAVSAGIVKGQLDAADRALDAMRQQDDGGVADKERRAKRNAIKLAHKAVKANVDDFTNARRIAHAHAAAARAALDAHTLRVLAFKNALARKTPAALTASTEYAVPLPVRLVGLTAHELMMLLLVTLVPYQALRLSLFVGTSLGTAINWARGKPSKAAAAAFPGGAGRVLGRSPSTAAAVAGTARRPWYKRALVVLVFNLFCSFGASAAVFWYMPALTAPAFAYVTPASLWFTWRHVIAPMHQVIVAASVVWGHVLQVWFTV